MNPTALPQIIGNLSVAIATLVFLFPLQHLLADYARKEVSHNQWVTPALFILIPLWLLLMVALLCMTASGGFDRLRLGRPALYALSVAAAVALAVVTFVFVAMYIRPGFTPRALYYPMICLAPLATALLVVLNLNQKFAPGISTQWLIWPWTIFAAVSLAACVAFSSYWIVQTGARGMVQLAFRIGNPGPSTAEMLAKISTLDPDKNFDELLPQVSRYTSREVREAVTARLRSNPKFLERLATELETGYAEPALAFLRDTALTPAEQARFGRPARKAMQRWVSSIPAPNYTTEKRLKELRRWGEEMFRVLPEKFASTGVDFAPVIEDFKDKVEPPK